MNSKSSSETYGLSFLEVSEITRAVARLEYGSHGTLAANIPEAVTLLVNGKEAAKLDVPEEIGEWSERFDIKQFLLLDRANELEIAVKTYNFEPRILPGRIETIAAVRIYIGSKRIFSENYSTRNGYRISTDKLKFSPSDI